MKNIITKNQLKKSIKLGILLVLLLGAVIFLVINLINFYPKVYHYSIGKNNFEKFSHSFKSNNSHELASEVMQWLQLNVKAPYGGKTYFGYQKWGVFNVDNKPTLFIRSNYPSWTLKSKLGNCGENADLFVSVMNQLGHYARKIIVVGEDHVLAEYYDENEIKRVVDPSNNLEINDTLEYGFKTRWSLLIAYDLNGNEEDVTSEFITNISVLTITTNQTKSFLGKPGILLESTLLMDTANKLYHKPQPIKYIFLNKTEISISVGSKKNYQIKHLLNYGLFKFEEVRPIDLSHNQTIQYEGFKVVKIKNLRLTQLGLLVLIPMSLILLFWMYKKFSFINKQRLKT